MQAALCVEARRTAVWAIAASQQRAAATSLGPLFGQPLRHRHPPPRDQDAAAKAARGPVKPFVRVILFWTLVDHHRHVAHARVQQGVCVAHVDEQLIFVDGVEGGLAAASSIELFDVPLLLLPLFAALLLPLLAALRVLFGEPLGELRVLLGEPLDDCNEVLRAADDVIRQAQHRADDPHVRRRAAFPFLHVSRRLGHRVLLRHGAQRRE